MTQTINTLKNNLNLDETTFNALQDVLCNQEEANQLIDKLCQEIARLKKKRDHRMTFSWNKKWIDQKVTDITNHFQDFIEHALLKTNFNRATKIYDNTPYSLVKDLILGNFIRFHAKAKAGECDDMVTYNHLGSLESNTLTYTLATPTNFISHLTNQLKSSLLPTKSQINLEFHILTIEIKHLKTRLGINENAKLTRTQKLLKTIFKQIERLLDQPKPYQLKKLQKAQAIFYRLHYHIIETRINAQVDAFLDAERDKKSFGELSKFVQTDETMQNALKKQTRFWSWSWLARLFRLKTSTETQINLAMKTINSTDDDLNNSIANDQTNNQPPSNFVSLHTEILQGSVMDQDPPPKTDLVLEESYQFNENNRDSIDPDDNSLGTENSVEKKTDIEEETKNLTEITITNDKNTQTQHPDVENSDNGLRENPPSPSNTPFVIRALTVASTHPRFSRNNDQDQPGSYQMSENENDGRYEAFVEIELDDSKEETENSTTGSCDLRNTLFSCITHCHRNTPPAPEETHEGSPEPEESVWENYYFGC